MSLGALASTAKRAEIHKRNSMIWFLISSEGKLAARECREKFREQKTQLLLGIEMEEPKVKAELSEKLE